MTKEQKFYKALQDVFIGAKIEGEGGFVNLMRIKSNYYRKIEEILKEDIEAALKSHHKFRDELFDKLYSFFSRYFTESGSIYFNSTPFHNNIYEKVYTDEKDVILFWKTQMLYYVKTDRIFRSLPVEFPSERGVDAEGGRGVLKFYFDASKIENKKANEKRSLIFELNKISEDPEGKPPHTIASGELRGKSASNGAGGTIVFSVQYSERGAKTKQDEILKAINPVRYGKLSNGVKRKGLPAPSGARQAGIAITEEQLERAFRVFEKQSEVDFFINKNAKAFLEEQFKLWSYQYFWEGAKEWGADRVNQLQILKNIAFKIIDFISQFEDELVKIWNKPKFVKNSNYVITLDRIKEEKLIEKIFKHEGIKAQIKEWQELGIVDEKFKVEDVFENSPSMKGWQAFPSERGVDAEGGRGVPDWVVKWNKLPFNPDLKKRAKELRKAGNLSEVLLWNQIKNKQFLGLDFDRQKIIGNYIVDFYCKDLGVVVEIDGVSHDGKIEYDKQRDDYFRGLGLNVIHILDVDVKNNLQGVMDLLKQELKHPVPSGHPSIRGEFNPVPSGHPSIRGEFNPVPSGHPSIRGEFNPVPSGHPSIRGEFKCLPIDTKYFKDLEFEILSQFEDLDKSLDGWLIKSENYQALNTILPKFKEKVQIIYIDPPFNKETDADYFYSVKYKDSSWATLLENRLRTARDFLNKKGSIFVRCDYNGNWIVRCLMDGIFGMDNFRNEIIVRRGSPKAGLFIQFGELKSVGVMYDNLYWFSKNTDTGYTGFIKILPEERKGYWASFKKIYDRPTMRYEILGINLTKGQWMWNKERALKAVENYQKYLEESHKTKETIEEYWLKTGKKLEFVRRQNDTIQYWVTPKETTLLDNNWLDIAGYSSGWGFTTENAEILLKRVLESTSNKNDLVFDFFLGSGTTTAVAHKLGRKWLGVEMGEHFYTVVLPRMKKVLAYDKSGISKEVKEYQGGGFFKYYELEQYEEALANCKYGDSDLFYPVRYSKLSNGVNSPSKTPYQEYVFMKDEKMLKALEIDYKKEKVKVDLSKLYPNIDIAETLSNLTGKWIKKISDNEVEFEDGTKIHVRQSGSEGGNTKDLDYKLIKPLIWWE